MTIKPRKLVRSTRDYREHLTNILAFKELKASGMSDREIAKRLEVGFSTLQKYKDTLAELNLESLSPEYLLEKRLEVDTQIESLLYRLNNIMSTIEDEHKEVAEEIKKAIQDVSEDDSKYRDKVIKLKRMAKYPSKDIAEIARLALDTIKARILIWGERDASEGGNTAGPKKIVVNVEAPKEDIEKLNNLADVITQRQG